MGKHAKSFGDAVGWCPEVGALFLMFIALLVAAPAACVYEIVKPTPVAVAVRPAVEPAKEPERPKRRRITRIVGWLLERAE